MARFSRRRPRRSRSISKVRPLEWVGYNSVDGATGSPAAHVSMAGGAGTVYANYILSPDEMTTLYDEPTLVRSILRWNVSIASGVTANNDWFFAWGLIALNLEAPGGTLPAAVLGYIPLPFFDADSDWIYEFHSTQTSGMTLTTSIDATLTGVGEHDIRTRRKFPNGHGLALVAYYATTGGIGQANVQFSGRLLFANR